MSSFSLFFPVSLSLDFSLVASVSLVFSSLPFFLIHCVSSFVVLLFAPPTSAKSCCCVTVKAWSADTCGEPLCALG